MEKQNNNNNNLQIPTIQQVETRRQSQSFLIKSRRNKSSGNIEIKNSLSNQETTTPPDIGYNYMEQNQIYMGYLQSMWDNKQQHQKPTSAQPDNAASHSSNQNQQTNPFIIYTFRKRINDLKKEMLEEYQETLKNQVGHIKEEMAKDYDMRVQALKDTYVKEIKAIKDKYIEAKKEVQLREKLIKKMMRIISRQELQQSTENLAPFLEFDREPELNMLDIGKLKEDMIQKRKVFKTLEVETEEYIQLRQQIKDLEAQNQILIYQNRMLRMKAFEDVNPNKIKQEMFQQKLAKSKNKSRKDFSMMFTDGIQKQISEGTTEQMLLKKRQEILKRRRPTYEESILLKSMQLDNPQFEKDNSKLFVDLTTLGLPPRPEEELIEEIQIQAKYEMDKQFSQIQSQYIDEKTTLSKALLSKDNIIIKQRERLDKMRQQLKKAVQVIKVKSKDLLKSDKAKQLITIEDLDEQRTAVLGDNDIANQLNSSELIDEDLYSQIPDLIHQRSKERFQLNKLNLEMLEGKSLYIGYSQKKRQALSQEGGTPRSERDLIIARKRKIHKTLEAAAYRNKRITNKTTFQNSEFENTLQGIKLAEINKDLNGIYQVENNEEEVNKRKQSLIQRFNNTNEYNNEEEGGPQNNEGARAQTANPILSRKKRIKSQSTLTGSQQYAQGAYLQTGRETTAEGTLGNTSPTDKEKIDFKQIVRDRKMGQLEVTNTSIITMALARQKRRLMQNIKIKMQKQNNN